MTCTRSISIRWLRFRLGHTSRHFSNFYSQISLLIIYNLLLVGDVTAQRIYRQFLRPVLQEQWMTAKILTGVPHVLRIYVDTDR